MDAQKLVSDAVKARGYRDGWTAEQFAARQVAKLQEELGELAKAFRLPVDLNLLTDYAARVSRESFDNPDLWSGKAGDTWPGIATDMIYNARQELADIQVVVFALADVLAEIDRYPFDVVAAAVAKSGADVKRGVR